MNLFRLSIVAAVLMLLNFGWVQGQPPEPKKLPAPSAEELRPLEKDVDAVFKTTQVGQSKDPEAKRKLAAQLLATATATPEPNAERYVLLHKALELGSAGGDLQIASRALSELERHFEIDRYPLLLAAVEASLGAVAPPAARRETIQFAMTFVDEAVQAEDFDTAGKLSTMLSRAVTKVGDRELARKVSEQRSRSAEIYKEYQRAKPALEKLASDPTDAASNAIVGKYYCLTRGDWARGLSMLALGDDEKLAAVAVIELQAASDAAAQLRVADAWWDYADDAPRTQQSTLRAHAGAWYAKAAPGLSGIAATKARQRAVETTAAAQGGILYLDDLKITDSFVGHGTLGKHGSAGYDVGDGSQVLRYQNAPIEHALSTHPFDGRPAHVDIELPAEVTALQAILTLGKKPDSAVTFKVFGDGKELWRSPAMTQRWVDVPCRVSLSGVRKLRLEVHAAGGAGNTWAYWINPHVVVKTDQK